MYSGNTVLLKLPAKSLIKYENTVAGIDDGVGVQHHIRTVVDPGQIPDRLLLTNIGNQREIIKGKDAGRVRTLNSICQSCLNCFAVPALVFRKKNIGRTKPNRQLLIRINDDQS